jgi:hypothetical protein
MPQPLRDREVEAMRENVQSTLNMFFGGSLPSNSQLLDILYAVDEALQR